MNSITYTRAGVNLSERGRALQGASTGAAPLWDRGSSQPDGAPVPTVVLSRSRHCRRWQEPRPRTVTLGASHAAASTKRASCYGEGVGASPLQAGAGVAGRIRAMHRVLGSEVTAVAPHQSYKAS